MSSWQKQACVPDQNRSYLFTKYLGKSIIDWKNRRSRYAHPNLCKLLKNRCWKSDRKFYRTIIRDLTSRGTGHDTTNPWMPIQCHNDGSFYYYSILPADQPLWLIFIAGQINLNRLELPDIHPFHFCHHRLTESHTSSLYYLISFQVRTHPATNRTPNPNLAYH